jgi:DNA polymerase-3 subunit delta
MARGAPDTIFSLERGAGQLEPLQRVYLVYGEDDLQKAQIVQMLVERCVDPGARDFDYEVLDAREVRSADVLSAAGMLPFSSERRVVVVNGAEVYRQKERASDGDRLAAGLCSLGDASCLVLLVAPDEKDRGRKTALTPKLDAAVRSVGAVVCCKALSEQELARWAVGVARSGGKVLDPPAATLLARGCRGDRIFLGHELEKAVCYVGDRERITLRDVEAVSVRDPEDVMLKVADAVARGDADSALRLFRETLRYEGKPPAVAGRLLALLRFQYRLMWQAVELNRLRIGPQDLNRLPEDVAAELPSEGSIVSHSWRAGGIYGAASRHSRAGLAHAFDLLVECDVANKGGDEGSEDVVTNLDRLILALCRTK